jgi:hypothetical protein
VLYAFDLDGTLIDSREAVLTAYRAVGVEPPPDFFGKSWREWLLDPVKHKAKNAVYLKMIEEGLVKELPLLELYRTLDRYEHAYILTGASLEAGAAIVKRWGFAQDRTYFGLSLDNKLQWMQFYRQGIMFEDNEFAVRRMRKETRWTICHGL